MVRVLIVEEDERLRNLLRAFLMSHGFRVNLARDAASARHALAHGPVDVLLVELDGAPESLLSELLDGSGEATPAVAITTADLPSAQRRALGVPVLRKPFDPDELLLLLADAAQSGLART